MISCPQCRHPNPVDSGECQVCGASLLGATLMSAPPAVDPADREATTAGRTLFGLAPPPLLSPDDTVPSAMPMEVLLADASRQTLMLSSPLTAEGSPKAESAGASTAGGATLMGVAAPSTAARPAKSAPAAANPAPAAANPAPAAKPAPRAAAPAPDPLDMAETRKVTRDARRSSPAAVPRAASPEPAAPAPAAPHRPGATTLLHHEAAEILNASRIAAAMDETTQRARQVRARRILWGLLGLAVLLAVGAAFDYRSRHRFQANVAGELRVQRDTQGYNVRVRLKTSEAAHLTLPPEATGGPVAPLEGEVEVGFRLPEAALPVGDNRLAMKVAPVADPTSERTLALQVRVYYRFTSTIAEAPAAGTALSLKMQVMPGWHLTVKDAQVQELPGGTLVLTLDSAPLLAAAAQATGDTGELPLILDLSGPGGESAHFTERLHFPLPPTGLSLTTPLRSALQTSETVDIEGVASPGATVQIGQNAKTVAVVDAAGHFKLSAPVAKTLEVVAQLPGHAAARQTVDVERVTAAILAARLAEARVAVDRVRTPAPPYAAALKAVTVDPNAPPIRLQGRVLAMRRGEGEGANRADELQIATCPAGCPYWVVSMHAVFAAVGQNVFVVGRPAGQQTFTTQSGQTVTAPRIESQAVVPVRP